MTIWSIYFLGRGKKIWNIWHHVHKRKDDIGVFELLNSDIESRIFPINFNEVMVPRRFDWSMEEPAYFPGCWSGYLREHQHSVALFLQLPQHLLQQHQLPRSLSQRWPLISTCGGFLGFLQHINGCYVPTVTADCTLAEWKLPLVYYQNVPLGASVVQHMYF